MQPEWKMLHPRARATMLGFLPTMLDDSDPAPAAKQFHKYYAHGGGWQPFAGHSFNAADTTLRYPGDPPMRAIAETWLRDERIILFESEWVMILQKDGSHEICRMD